MALPNPVTFSPLTMPQTAWLRGQENKDGFPTPPAIDTAWLIDSNNAWLIDADNAWIIGA